MAFGNTSPAYNAASDYVIDQDDFIEQALLETRSNRSYVAADDGSDVEEHCAKIVQDAVREASEPVHLSLLASKIDKAYPGINSDWQGKGSFKHFLAGSGTVWIEGTYRECTVGFAYMIRRDIISPSPKDKEKWLKNYPALASFVS